ncbi:hypothetical protein [Paraburkholderia youngii]|uniref:hypothetical protein n=1 Tax=Paraburkholderia youngii TaxID=2782701 RepID=UPI001590DBF3|nr:hypothetical protein [Paraburkholderia youngii]NUX52318.1 hypothetical protein [Paraburkholderia youngii]
MDDFLSMDELKIATSVQPRFRTAKRLDDLTEMATHMSDRRTVTQAGPEYRVRAGKRGHVSDFPTSFGQVMVAPKLASS